MTLEDYELHFKPMIRDYFYSLMPTGRENKDEHVFTKIMQAESLVRYLIPRLRLVKNIESNMSSVNKCVNHVTDFLNELQMDLEDDN